MAFVALPPLPLRPGGRARCARVAMAAAGPPPSRSRSVAKRARPPPAVRLDRLFTTLDPAVPQWFPDVDAAVAVRPSVGVAARRRVRDAGVGVGLGKGPARVAPKRKRHGFWNDLANVEQELVAVNVALGRSGTKIVPRLSEMSSLGRGDLIAAINKHGGIKLVAENLRWGRGGKTRRAVAEDVAGAAVGVDGIRSKILRRPKAYWSNVDRVRSEIGAFIAEYGTPGVMPTQAQFNACNRADLVNAAQAHGGIRVIAESMGLKCRRVAKKRLFRTDFGVFKASLLDFAGKHCPGRMPTANELNAKGATGLAIAVTYHGGFPAVAKKLGLAGRNTRSQGAPQMWDKARLSKELRLFTVKHLPELALKDQMPSERQLRGFGRNDLSYAINKFGGFATVTKLLNFSEKKRGPFNMRRL